MNSRIIPITLAVVSDEERERLISIVKDMPMARIQPDEAEDMGVLVYEPGPSADEDFPHIFHALESGQAEDVFLVGEAPDPDLLIRAMRHGIREFLKAPVTKEDFRAALMRTALRESLEGGGPRGRIISVLGSKAGLGTTTLAVNLACAINERTPGEAALLDLRQPVGEVPLFLDLQYEFTWGQLLDDISRLDSTYLRSAMAEHGSGLHVLPAPEARGGENGQEMFLILEHLRQAYANVVVDASPMEDDLLPKAVEQADIILLITDLAMPSLARTVKLMDTLRAEDPDTERRIRLVANRVTKNSGVDLDEAQKVLEMEFFGILPEDYSTALSSINQGIPWLSTAPKSQAAKEFRRVARELVPEDSRQGGGGFSLSGLFGKFGRKNEAVEHDGEARVSA